MGNGGPAISQPHDCLSVKMQEHCPPALGDSDSVLRARHFTGTMSQDVTVSVR